MKQFVFSSVLILFVYFLVAGCTPAPYFTYGELREEIWIAPFDYWYVKMVWTFNRSETDNVFPQIETYVAEKCRQAPVTGVSCKFVKQRNMDGGITLLIESTGQGLDFLNLAAFDGKANVQRDAKAHVLIDASFPVPNLRYYSLSFHGGPIIQSNATKQELFFALW